MIINIPEEIVQVTHVTEEELVRETALWLYQADRLTLGQASHFAQMSVPQFMELLNERGIPPHYDIADLLQDVETLRQLREKQ